MMTCVVWWLVPIPIVIHNAFLYVLLLLLCMLLRLTRERYSYPLPTLTLFGVFAALRGGFLYKFSL